MRIRISDLYETPADEPKPVAGERDEVWKARQEAYRIGYSKDQPYVGSPLFDKDFELTVTPWLPKDPTKAELEYIENEFFNGRWNRSLRKRNMIRLGTAGGALLALGAGLKWWLWRK